MESLAQLAPTGAMLAMVAAAAYSDLKTGLIPNRIVLAGAACGAIAHAALALTQGVAVGSLTYTTLGGLLLCSVVPGVFYALGAMGGGDLKLFAAIGLCMGPLAGMDIQLWSYVLALLFVPIYLARQGRLRTSLRHSGELLRNLVVPRTKRTDIPRESLTSVRFAPAIFAAAVLCTVVQQALGGNLP